MRRVVLVGATGNVGRVLLDILHERAFPADEVVPLASTRSVGTSVPYGEETLAVRALDDFAFAQGDVVLSSPGGSVSATFAPKAVAAGAVVIDNTSHFRMDDAVPLVVPEVNLEALSSAALPCIIANPNCCTIALVMTLKPLMALGTIIRAVVATYQSVSGAGYAASEELFESCRGVFANRPHPKKHFTKELAFNVIPHIDAFRDDGDTKEEWKMRVETAKILGTSLAMSVTCVRVPVFVGHGAAVWVEFADAVDENRARDAMKTFPGVSVVDHRQDEGYVTPKESAGEDAVFVSRVRADHGRANGLAYWLANDNLRKGAALNAVQIAEELVRLGAV